MGGLRVSGITFWCSYELGNYTKPIIWYIRLFRFVNLLGGMSDIGIWRPSALWKRQRQGDHSRTRIMLWSITNLAVYYGHAGRIQEYHEHFLNLRLDPKCLCQKEFLGCIFIEKQMSLADIDSVPNFLFTSFFLRLKSRSNGQDRVCKQLDSLRHAVETPDYEPVMVTCWWFGATAYNRL